MARIRAIVTQLYRLSQLTEKKWLVPLFLGFIILALAVLSIELSPVPIFVYPFL
jgi:hypothetical protein